jgi:3-hydroxyacyl-CoA dehydrogenase/enoyl-CoA hydratase/3-hydroxybutyryl-CoA epimerase
MPDVLTHLKLDRDSRGVATVTIDVQDNAVNVIHAGVADDLQRVLDQLEQQPARAVVFRSSKSSGFCAGADVKQIQLLATAEQAQEALQRGQQLFDRIEQLPCPTIAVIHGLCLGGGLELALACRFRIARDDPQTRLGLPETQLGLIPGWGGTSRLPRVVGLRQALRMILEGQTLTSRKAFQAGLVDSTAEPTVFEQAVDKFVADRMSGLPVRRPGRGLIGGLLDGIGRGLVFKLARKKIQSKARHYPAIAAALRAIEAGVYQGHQAGLAAERTEFSQLVLGPVSRNLIELFLRREQARKASTWVPADTHPLAVQQAAVIGGGVMGAGIAQLLAVNGLPVVLKEITPELAAAGRERVTKLTRDAAAKGVLSQADAEAAIQRITPTADWEPVRTADLVIEAVVEREDVKREVFQELAQRVRTETILASNTSALSISRLSEVVTHPERVAGLHFFNPVHRMHLVEVVRTASTSDSAIATLVELVRRLGKVPVVVADRPGFLVNRILFPYLDEGVRLAIETGRGQGIDAEAEAFGMPMGPLALLDEVGIDIAAHVASTIVGVAADPSPTPARLAAMVQDGALGKKSGRGFYTYNKTQQRGVPTNWAWDGRSPEPQAARPAGELTPIQKRLIYPMINEAARCLAEGIVPHAWMIDLAMVLGTGFAPFRGGPLQTADAIGIANIVRELVDLQQSAGPRFEPCELLRVMATESRRFHPTRTTSTIPDHQEARR